MTHDHGTLADQRPEFDLLAVYERTETALRERLDGDRLVDAGSVLYGESEVVILGLSIGRHREALATGSEAAADDRVEA